MADSTCGPTYQDINRACFAKWKRRCGVAPYNITIKHSDFAAPADENTRLSLLGMLARSSACPHVNTL